MSELLFGVVGVLGALAQWIDGLCGHPTRIELAARGGAIGLGDYGFLHGAAVEAPSGSAAGARERRAEPFCLS